MMKLELFSKKYINGFLFLLRINTNFESLFM